MFGFMFLITLRTVWFSPSFEECTVNYIWYDNFVLLMIKSHKMGNIFDKTWPQLAFLIIIMVVSFKNAHGKPLSFQAKNQKASSIMHLAWPGPLVKPILVSR